MSVTFVTRFTVVALMLEEPLQQQEDHVRPRVADVDPAVDGRPADVDPDLARLIASRSAGSGRSACRATEFFFPRCANPSGRAARPPGTEGRVPPVAGTAPDRKRLEIVERRVPLPSRALSGSRQGLRRHLPHQALRPRSHLGGPLHEPRRARAQGRHAPRPRRDDHDRRDHLDGVCAAASCLGSRPSSGAASASAATSTTRSRSRGCSGCSAAVRRCSRSTTCRWVATGSRP